MFKYLNNLKIYKITIILIIATQLFGCNLLIPDEKNDIESYPMEYELLDSTRIYNFTNDEVVYSFEPTSITEGELTLFTGLTNSSKVNVSKIDRIDNNLIITLRGSKLKSNKYYKPRFKILIKGINPYNNYNININKNYEELKLNLKLEEALNIINSKIKLNNQRCDISTIDNYRDRIIWNLEFNTFNDESSTPLSKLSVKLDPKSREILNIEKTKIAKPLFKGKVISILNDRTLIYSSLDKELTLYNIPENKILKPLKLFGEFKLIHCDDHTETIYLYSNDYENTIFAINSYGNVKYIDTDGKKPKLFTVDENGKIYFVSDDKDNSLYKIERNKIEFIQSFNSNLVDINIKDNKLLAVWENDGEYELLKYDKKFKEVFIDYGSMPKFINSSNFVYLVNDEKNKNASLINYSLKTGLKEVIIRGPFHSIRQYKKNEIQMSKLQNGYYNIWIYDGKETKFLGNFPTENTIYLKSLNKALTTIENDNESETFLIDLDAQ